MYPADAAVGMAAGALTAMVPVGHPATPLGTGTTEAGSVVDAGAVVVVGTGLVVGTGGAIVAVVAVADTGEEGRADEPPANATKAKIRTARESTPITMFFATPVDIWALCACCASLSMTAASTCHSVALRLGGYVLVTSNIAR